MITNMKLKSCCRRSLKEIDETMKLGKFLQALILSSPFINMIGSNAVDTSYTILTSDWEMLKKAVSSCDKIAAHKCRYIAFSEITAHSGGGVNELKLKKYWTEIYNIFCDL